MQRTSKLARMVSTYGGMRRILKKQPPVPKYIRQAVESGVYQSDDAPPKGRPQRGMRREQRLEGEQFEYPIEYEILTMNPPIPEMPRTPKELEKEQRECDSLPTDKLIQSYLKRYDMRMRTAHPLTDVQREERMYARILGLSADGTGDEGATDTAGGRKQAVLDHAYKFAIRQYEVIRENEADGMTEEESVRVVEELLAKEAREERVRSRELAREATEWRKAREAAERAEKKEPTEATEATDDYGAAEPEREAPPSVAATSIPSILMGKPRTIRAMTMWSRRLAAVPYSQWTVGAATALDHWIAMDVLGMSEETWHNMLRGDPGEDEEVMTGRLAEVGADHHSEGVSVGNAARAKDIVTVRSSLFPETVLFDTQEADEAEEEMAAFGEEENDEVDATQKSIDELLASLGGFEADEDIMTAGKEEEKGDEDADQNAKIAELVDELQDWRAKNVEVPYEEWDVADKKDFNTWLSQYIAILTSDSDGPVDLESTRTALLSEPPTTRDESVKFWSNVADETQAEIYLQALREKGAPPARDDETAQDRKAREDMETFLSLPFERQLRKLVDMGTLRPVLDEYAPETERLEFLRRHARSFMEGTEVEHLVPDPAGPIRAEDVGGDLLDELDVGRGGGRYRIEMIRYGSDEYGKSSSERARSLWRAWSAHKAGRAAYEEVMFKKGKVGLRDTSGTATARKKRQDEDR